MALGKAQQGWTDRVIEALVAAFAVAAMAVGVSMVTGGQASAPEPARLTQELGTSTGALASAYYTGSTTQTSVLKWPGTWAPGNVAAGTPCSTSGLMEGQTTDKVIHAYNSYRKCM